MDWRSPIVLKIHDGDPASVVRPDLRAYIHHMADKPAILLCYEIRLRDERKKSAARAYRKLMLV